jgi:hypothetical protein
MFHFVIFCSANSGWIFEYHAKGSYAIVQQVEGTYTDLKARYRYANTVGSNEPLRAYLGPGVENYQSGFSISPGAFVDGVGEWAEANRTDHEGNEVAGHVFVKLSNGQGWLLMWNEVSGAQQLTKL